MLRKVLAALDEASLCWVAIGLGFLVLGMNRWLPGIDWGAVPSEQSVLDQAFISSLQNQDWSYGVVPGISQTFGAHVLPQYLTVAVSQITGDAARAGLWLSVVGVVATLCGMYTLTQRIFPLRAFSVITLTVTGAIGTLQFAISPDPSSALGMALVVWGMSFFLTAVTKLKPNDIFMCGFLFGLAGYVRIELSVIGILLALYLLVVSIVKASVRDPHPYFAMSLGLLFTVAAVLWPMLDRNLSLAGSPILPGFDAELVLGAPRLSGQAGSTPFSGRLLQGLKLLMFAPRGLGVFAGLLWPIGVGICLCTGRHKSIPYFWLPIVLGSLISLSTLSYVTGVTAFTESLLILTPMLFPFAVLPLAVAVYQWMQTGYRPLPFCRMCWIGAGILMLLLVQLPHLVRVGGAGDSDLDRHRAALMAQFNALSDEDQSAMWMSDMPGTLLTAGKAEVIGTRGETDWRILSAKYANGSFQTDKLLNYLEQRDVGLIHLSDPENPLIDELRLAAGAPRLEPVPGFSPPHRVFRVDRP
jgi:hypothetical protein